MRKFSSFVLTDTAGFLSKLLAWGNNFQKICVLNSNNYSKTFASPNSWHEYDIIAAFGSIGEFIPEENNTLESLEQFRRSSGDWLFGHLGYDLKNQIEALTSNHPDKVNFPKTGFFIPEYIFIVSGNKLEIGWHTSISDECRIISLAGEIEGIDEPEKGLNRTGRIKSVISKKQYLRAVKSIKNHIQKGDIYEVNFCQEFYSMGAEIDPVTTWLRLIKESPTPFSCYYRLKDKFLLCASPERFIKKTGNKIISQPIKGTSARGKTGDEDSKLLELLADDPKERAENIMITDLVRNDLSKIATRASVKVDELCKIYPFPGVFQMQSLVTAELPSEISFHEIIKATFPMGSMTGAPKVRAMEIIEQYEKSCRGLYSGAVGYISPEMNLDFNVVIRSIQYNHTDSYLSFMVGGAITSLSVPENEYCECILKAGAILRILGKTI
jgi:para-aminobenzoate synthetase component I